MADHHREHNYKVMSDDVIRFADQQGLDKFTVMGHSMGGRTAMTLACRYPDRVDGFISLDAAPVDESKEVEQFGSFAGAVLDFLHDLKEKDKTITYNQVIEAADKFFNGKPQFKALVSRNLDLDQNNGPDDPAKWLINAKTLRDEFLNIPYFDEDLRFEGPGLNIVGGRSRQYPFESYKKVFPNYTEQDVVTIPEAGHWVHFDSPKETMEIISAFLQRIDG